MSSRPPASRTRYDRPSDVDLSYDAVVDRLRTAGCVFAEDEATLLIGDARSPAQLAAMVHRRVTGEPLEQILGWAEFCNLRIVVEPGVFVPRQRTALMVTAAVALIRGHRPEPGPTVVVDLCCGAGAVGAALFARLTDCEVYASDIDPIAVACAARNLPPGAHTFVGDLYAPLPADLRGRVELLVANAPYVPTDALRLMPPEARLHEPAAALDGGHDGLRVLRRVIADAPQWLSPGGQLLVESGEEQALMVAEAMSGAGLLPRVVTSDELGATVVIAERDAG